MFCSFRKRQAIEQRMELKNNNDDGILSSLRKEHVKSSYNVASRLREEAKERNKKWLEFCSTTRSDLEKLHDSSVIKSEVRLELAKVCTQFSLI